MPSNTAAPRAEIQAYAFDLLVSSISVETSCCWDSTRDLCHQSPVWIPSPSARWCGAWASAVIRALDRHHSI